MLTWALALARGVTASPWALGALCAALLWAAHAWAYGHFRRRGLPHAAPLPFFGSMAPVTLGLTAIADFVLQLYRRYDGLPLFGIYQFLTPVVVVRDPDIIRKVAVKDFDHFVDHQPFVTEKLDPVMSKNLFSMRGQEWRDMRATLSPAFTSSKMRNIFKLIDACGEQTVVFLKKKIAESPRNVYETDMKDFFTRFTNDVIATSAFGIQCDSLNEPQNNFYVMGKRLTKTSGARVLIFFGFLFSPKLMEILNLPFIPAPVSAFFHGIVHETIVERQKRGIVRPDMLQLLMQAREGQLKAEAGDEQETLKGARALKLTDNDITAQAVIFFFGGFDTVSTLMCFAALELARHAHVQRRAQREVDEAARAAGGPLSYEAVMQLKYLDMVLNEVLRLYPPVAFLNRMCVADYTFEGNDKMAPFTVRKDDVVWFPIAALHRDPQYWSRPDDFDPERFSDENKDSIKPFTYMPFGVGPRICIGFRFALLETKLALVHILQHFSFQCTAKTPKTVKFAKNNFNAAVEGGFWVGIAPRE